MPDFYTIAGIRFQNFDGNEAVISSKLTAIIKGGWELMLVIRGFETNVGASDVQGLIITRHQFGKV